MSEAPKIIQIKKIHDKQFEVVVNHRNNFGVGSGETETEAIKNAYKNFNWSDQDPFRYLHL